MKQSVNGHTFAFTELVEVLCNFKWYKEKIKFFLIDSLPHPFLLGYPFFKKQGAVFDLTKPTVTLSAVQSLSTIRLLGTSDEDRDVFGLISGENSLFCTLNQDISEDEAQAQLQSKFRSLKVFLIVPTNISD